MQNSAKSSVRHHAALLVILFLALAGAWTWRLWPRTAAAVAAMPDETVRLEQLKTVATYLSKAPASVVKPILASLAGVSDNQLAVLRDWVEKASAQQLRELTVQDQLPVSSGVRDALLLAWLGQEEKAPVMESYLMIAAAGNRVGEDVKLFALEQLADEAVNAGQAAMAATILERAVKLPLAKWETLTHLVEVCRGAGDYQAAAVAVRSWMKQRASGENGGQLEEARDLEVTLMLEAGRADEALSGQLEILQAAPADLLPVAVLDRARVCASAAKQSKRMGPWIEKHLANFREDRTEWHGLLGRTDIDPEYRRWLTNFIGIAEEQGGEKRVFELYLRLAACGERNALPRLCELAMPADRVEMCREFLTQALEQPALQAAILELGQEQVIASRVVGARLKGKPKDRDFHFAAALAEAAVKPVEASAMVWQNFLRRFPKDAAGQRRLVQCHLAAKQPAMARRVMEGMEKGRLTESDVKGKEGGRRL